MESQPQNPEFRNNPENFHPCIMYNLQIGNINPYKPYILFVGLLQTVQTLIMVSTVCLQSVLLFVLMLYVQVNIFSVMLG